MDRVAVLERLVVESAQFDVDSRSVKESFEDPASALLVHSAERIAIADAQGLLTELAARILGAALPSHDDDRIRACAAALEALRNMSPRVLRLFFLSQLAPAIKPCVPTVDLVRAINYGLAGTNSATGIWTPEGTWTADIASAGLAFGAVIMTDKLSETLEAQPWLFSRGVDLDRRSRIVAEFPASRPLFTPANPSVTRVRLLGVDRATFIEHVALNHSSLTRDEAVALVDSMDTGVLQFDRSVANEWFDVERAEATKAMGISLQVSASGREVLKSIGDAVHLHWWD